MNEMVAYCGLLCSGCPIYWATREKDDAKRKQMRADIAREIKKQYGKEYKPEDINDCDGCRTEGGRLFSGCKDCQIRNCARQKSLENCAHCDEYPCEELEKLFTTDKDARKRLDAVKNTI